MKAEWPEEMVYDEISETGGNVGFGTFYTTAVYSTSEDFDDSDTIHDSVIIEAGTAERCEARALHIAHIGEMIELLHSIYNSEGEWIDGEYKLTCHKKAEKLLREMEEIK